MKNDTERTTLSSVYRKKTIKHKVFLAIVAVTAIVLFFIPTKKPTPVIQKEAPAIIETIEPDKRQEVRKYSKEEVEQWKKEREVTIVTELEKHFDKDEARVAIAIIKSESSMNYDATGYNCRYEKIDAEGKTVLYSTSCKKGDEAKAWSIDCGISQINFVGLKQCPAKTKELAWSVATMAEMHEERGWKPWSVYNTGLYKKYLN